MKNGLSDIEWKRLLCYFNDDELAAKVWLEKYALKSYAGEFLEKTPATISYLSSNLEAILCT